MLQESVAIISVIMIVNGFLFFAIKNISKKLNDEMKKSILSNLSVYDEIIEKKETRLNELNKELLDLKLEFESYQIESKKDTSNNIIVTSINSDEDTTVYEDDTFYENYSLIRNEFRVNYKEIVKEFLFNDNENDRETYNLYKSLLEKFNLDVYYSILKFDEEVREDRVKEILSEKELKILDEFKNESKVFDIELFYNYLKEKVRVLNPNLIILGNSNSKYLEKMDLRINFKEDESIVEGIKILYKGKIFDYSL